MNRAILIVTIFTMLASFSTFGEDCSHPGPDTHHELQAIVTKLCPTKEEIVKEWWATQAQPYRIAQRLLKELPRGTRELISSYNRGMISTFEMEDRLPTYELDLFLAKINSGKAARKSYARVSVFLNEKGQVAYAVNAEDGLSTYVAGTLSDLQKETEDLDRKIQKMIDITLQVQCGSRKR